MDRIAASPATKERANMAASGCGGRVKKSRRAAMLAAILATLVVIGIFLTGCTVEYGLDTIVEADGSGTVGVRLAADKELQEALSSAADSLGGLGDLGDLESLGDLGGLGDFGDLGILGSILGGLGGLGDSGVLENLGALGRILEALGALNDLTGELPTSADELFNLILGQIPGDWQVERGTDSSGTSYVSLSRSFSDLEELEQIMSESVIASMVPMDEFHIYQDKGFFGTKTVFSTSLDPEEAMSGSRGEDLSLPADLLESVLAIQNRLTLPGEIKDNNADQVEGSTLVWNIGLSGKTEMYGESVVRNWGAIIGVTVGGVVVLALIVMAVVLLLRRRRRKAPPSQPTEADAVGITAQGAGHGEGAKVSSDALDAATPATQTDVTVVKPHSPVVPPPTEEVLPPTAMAATAAVAGAAVGATVVASVGEETPDDATAAEAATAETAMDQAAADQAAAKESAPPGPEEPAVADGTAAVVGRAEAEQVPEAQATFPDVVQAPEAAPVDPQGTEQPGAGRPNSAGEQTPVEATGAPAEAPADAPPKPPTPIPLRPSRVPAQETGEEAPRDPTKPNSEVPDEPPAAD